MNIIAEPADSGQQIRAPIAGGGKKERAPKDGGSDNSKLACALRLAAAGYRVFPLAPNSKIPALDADWRRIATNDPAKVRDLWVCKFTDWIQPYNIGIALDSDVLVVDVDVSGKKQGRESLRRIEMENDALPGTYMSKTASGGFHHFFRVPPDSGPFKRELAEHVDLKSAGGYVVGEGSTIDGRRYNGAIGSPGALRDAPAWLIELARRPAGALAPAQAGINSDDQDSPAAIVRAIDYLTRTAPDHGTYKVACQVKDFGVSEDKCWELLCEHWSEARDLGKGPEHIRDKVSHAYKYGQNPVGSRSPEIEFEAVEITPSPTGADVPQNVMTFTRRSSHGYLVKGLLNFGMTALVTGLPNAGKTPLALDIGAHVAKGEPWRGMRVKQAYVLCVATEGWTGFDNRMTAIRDTHFEGVVGEAPFEFETRELDLVSTSRHAEALIEKINRRATRFGLVPGLLIIDTLSHTLAGGDDSDQKIVRPALKNIARIVAATGAAVLATHHPTKGGTSDTRGSSILTFDTDLLMKVEADEKRRLSKVTTPRTKDYGQIKPMFFRNRIVEIGKDEDGDPITTVIAEWQADAEDEFAIKLSIEQEDALQVLKNLVRDRMLLVPGTEAPAIGTRDWRKAYERVRQTSSGDDAPRDAVKSTFQRVVNALKDAGCVTQVEAVKGKESLWKLAPRQPRQTAPH